MAKQQMNIGISELNKDEKFKVVFINGKRIQIKKGEDVEVEPIIKDIIKESNALRLKGNTQDTNPDGTKGLHLEG